MALFAAVFLVATAGDGRVSARTADVSTAAIANASPVRTIFRRTIFVLASNAPKTGYSQLTNAIGIYCSPTLLLAIVGWHNARQEYRQRVLVVAAPENLENNVLSGFKFGYGFLVVVQ